MRKARKEKPILKHQKQAALRKMEKTTNLIVVQVLQSNRWMTSDARNVNVKCAKEENAKGENAFVGNVNE
jgi:hypothetical protein